MQFVEDKLSLSVSEFNSDGKVGITMEDLDNQPYAYFMELGEADIKRLIDWLQGSLDEIKQTQG